MKVGIPKALLYHKYYPLWETFLIELGATPVLSSSTNKKILNNGIKNSPSDICLPVKVYFGHVLNLIGKVDVIFVPRVVSVCKTAYTCPKFLGLPDMVKTLPGAPKIITATVDLKKKKHFFYKEIYHLGRNFTANPIKIYLAFKKGMAAQKKFEESQKLTIAKKKSKGQIKLGVVGHPYNIHDSFISLNLLERLEKEGVIVETLEMIPKEEIEACANTLPKEIFWSYEKDIVGSILHWLNNKDVDGIIYMLSFACGPDSLMQVVIEDQVRKIQSVPLMSLVVDEHSAEAGLMTRLEAFLDMLKRSKISESNFAPNGQLRNLT